MLMYVLPLQQRYVLDNSVMLVLHLPAKGHCGVLLLFFLKYWNNMWWVFLLKVWTSVGGNSLCYCFLDTKAFLSSARLLIGR